jgi:hypothetical protein
LPARRRVLALLDCPEPLRQSYGRLIKALARQYEIRVVDHAEAPAGKRLADLVKRVGDPQPEVRTE